jgi:hypothetical protein
MRGKISVVGGGDAFDGLGGQRVTVVRLDAPAGDRLAGSDVVVVARGADVAGAARATARRASAAVLVVATGGGEQDCATALQASLLPRTRVVGVEPADAVAAVEAVLFECETPLECWALCRGELGIEDRVAQVPAVLGAGGIRRIGRA